MKYFSPEPQGHGVAAAPPKPLVDRCLPLACFFVCLLDFLAFSWEHIIGSLAACNGSKTKDCVKWVVPISIKSNKLKRVVMVHA